MQFTYLMNICAPPQSWQSSQFEGWAASASSIDLTSVTELGVVGQCPSCTGRNVVWYVWFVAGWWFSLIFHRSHGFVPLSLTKRPVPVCDIVYYNVCKTIWWPPHLDYGNTMSVEKHDAGCVSHACLAFNNLPPNIAIAMGPSISTTFCVWLVRGMVWLIWAAFWMAA